MWVSFISYFSKLSLSTWALLYLSSSLRLAISFSAFSLQILSSSKASFRSWISASRCFKSYSFLVLSWSSTLFTLFCNWDLSSSLSSSREPCNFSNCCCKSLVFSWSILRLLCCSLSLSSFSAKYFSLSYTIVSLRSVDSSMSLMCSQSCLASRNRAVRVIFSCLIVSHSSSFFINAICF